MVEIFLASMNPMLFLFICMATGYLLTKLGLIPDNAHAVLSKLEQFVFIPCLIINTFMNNCTLATLASNYSTIIYAMIACLLGVVICYPLSKLFVKEGYKRNVYKYAFAFANSGFMGNPVVQGLFGDEGLYNYMLYTLFLQFMIYTWGIAVLVPKEGKRDKNPLSFLKNLLNPCLISIAIGISLGLLGVKEQVPYFISNTLSSLAGCMGPIAMLLTGMVVAAYPMKQLLGDKKVYLASGLRLFVLPALFIAVLILLGADDKTLGWCLFATATPLGLNTVVFPAAYGCDTSTGASMAMISHVLSVLTIPLMYSLLTVVLNVI